MFRTVQPFRRSTAIDGLQGPPSTSEQTAAAGRDIMGHESDRPVWRRPLVRITGRQSDHAPGGVSLMPGNRGRHPCKGHHPHDVLALPRMRAHVDTRRRSIAPAFYALRPLFVSDSRRTRTRSMGAVVHCSRQSPGPYSRTQPVLKDWLRLTLSTRRTRLGVGRGRRRKRPAPPADSAAVPPTRPARSEASVVSRSSPRTWPPAAALEATLAWVDWFNVRWLFSPIDDIPPAEYKAPYYAQAAVA